MRIFSLLMLLAACDPGTAKCKKGTLLLSLTSDDGIDADGLEFTVSVDNGAAHPGRFGFQPSGTIEVDFPSGYPAGKMVSVFVSAQKSVQMGTGLAEVASGMASTTLSEGCDTLPIHLSKIGGGDGGLDLSMPGGGGDMTTVDLLPHPVAVIASTPDLVGFLTRLDGTGSTDPMSRALTYSWRFVAVPPGSTIDATSLKPSAVSDKPTFDPDRGGTYTVELTAIAPDGSHGITTADVVVPTVPIFYLEGKVNGDMGETLKMGVVRSDATGAHPFSCDMLPDGGFSGSSSTSFVGQTQQIGMLRSFYPPTGLPTVAYLQFFIDDSSNTSAKLFRADENSDCLAHPPTQIDSSDVTTANHIHAWPRFSPDGKRVVYLDESQDQGNDSNPVRVVTAGIDGSSVHVVRSSKDVGSVPAIWLDNTHLAWVETVTPAVGSAYKAIIKASDANFAGDSNVAPADRTEVIGCTDVGDGQQLTVINQIAVGGGGFVVAAGYRDRRPTFGTTYGSLNLYRMTNSCAAGSRTVLAEEPATGESWDFDVSPDGLTVVFASTHGQMVLEDGGATPQHDIFVVASDGSGSPKKLAGDPVLEDMGPFFVAGGRQIIWTQSNTGYSGKSSSGPSGGGLMIINADGTHQRSLHGNSSDDNNATLVTGGQNAGFTCDWAAGAAPAGVGLVLAIGAVLLVLSRRRRS